MIIKEQKGRSHGRQEQESGWLEEAGKHPLPLCPWEVAFERRLEASEEGKVLCGKNSMPGGSWAGRGIGMSQVPETRLSLEQ